MRTYEECEKYILDIPKFAAKNELADTYRILSELVDVDSIPHIIHIAGTNGKGSVSAFMRSILIEAGYHVGFFISPHLVDMTERIAVDYEDITREQFAEIFNKVKECVDRLVQEGVAHHPSFFEYIFLMAMTYYCEQKTDYIILETGLGGRLDATNCIKGIEKTCVITEIGFDHMQYLGDTIAKIAGEKAGIINEGATVIYMDKREDASAVIRDKCVEMHTHFTEVKSSDISNVLDTSDGLSFDVEIGSNHFSDMEISTKALYQCENAALAINTAVLLGVDEQVIRQGIKSMKWPGRMEKIGERIYLDGAHNEDGVDAMLASAGRMPGDKVLLFAVVSDKKYHEMIEKIIDSGVFRRVVVTRAGEDRATDVHMIANIFEEYVMHRGSIKGVQDMNPKTNGTGLGKFVYVEAYENIKEAYDHCIEIIGDDKTLIVTGSLYLVGEIKGLIF